MINDGRMLRRSSRMSQGSKKTRPAIRALMDNRLSAWASTLLIRVTRLLVCMRARSSLS